MIDLKNILTQLTDNTLSKKSRVGFTREIKAILKNNPIEPVRELCVQIIERLIIDPEQEVRIEIADSLLYLPEEIYQPLIATLLKDKYKYVRVAAKRTHSRRGKILRTDSLRSQPANSILEIHSELLKYGPDIADKVFDISQIYYDEMVSATIHELKAVKGPIEQSVKMIEKQLNKINIKNRVVDNRLEKIKKSVDHYIKILDDLKELTSDIKVDFHSESLLDILNEAEFQVKEFFGDESQEFDCGFKIDVTPDILVWVSRHQMIQVFRNIIKNAYEAQKGKKCTDDIKISGEINNSKIVVKIEDHGIGIAPKEMKTLFLPGKTGKRKTGGTGFGLPLSQRLVKALGGIIIVRSTVDVGSTFIVEIPHREEL